MQRLAKKKQRVASDSDAMGLPSMDVVHALADSPIGGGASAGVLAQQSGIMPIAVTLFTALAAVQFWRQAMPRAGQIAREVPLRVQHARINAAAARPGSKAQQHAVLVRG